MADNREPKQPASVENSTQDEGGGGSSGSDPVGRFYLAMPLPDKDSTVGMRHVKNILTQPHGGCKINILLADKVNRVYIYLGYEVIPYDAPNPLDVFSDPILRGQVRIIDVTEE